MIFTSISIIIYDYVTQSPKKSSYAVSEFFFYPELREVECKVNHAETLMRFSNITRAYGF